MEKVTTETMEKVDTMLRDTTGNLEKVDMIIAVYTGIRGKVDTTVKAITEVLAKEVMMVEAIISPVVGVAILIVMEAVVVANKYSRISISQILVDLSQKHDCSRIKNGGE